MPEVWWPYEYWSIMTGEYNDNQIFLRRKLDESDSAPVKLIETKILGDELNQSSLLFFNL